MVLPAQGQAAPALNLLSPGEPTTYQMAACEADADVALCLLRVSMASSDGILLITDPDIALNDALIAQLGLSVAQTTARINHISSSSSREWFAEAFQADLAALKAVELDRQGASPAEALAPIRALASADWNEEHVARSHARAYYVLWAMRGHPRGPSPALARAMLDAWAAELEDGSDGHTIPFFFGDVAARYVTIGDPEAAAALTRRTSLDDPVSLEIRMQTALGRIDRAAELALAAKPSTIEDPERRSEAYRDLIMAREDVADLALRTLHQDLALRLTVMNLQALYGPDRWPGPPSIDISISALRRLVLFGQPGLAARWADIIERSPGGQWSGVHARAGFETWLALGRHDRADRLLNHWRRLADRARAKTQRFAPDDEAIDTTRRMLLAVGENETARAYGPPPPPSVLYTDLRLGRGLVRLDDELALAKTHAERLGIYGDCVEAAMAYARFAEGSICVRRASVEAQTDEDRWSAAVSANRLANKAVKLGDPETIRRTRVEALALLSKAPEQSLGGGWIDPVVLAKGELKAQNRL
ncbi:hypothetical protein [Caulobacter sp. LARHSG274]